MGLIPEITLGVIPEQHFMDSGINPRTWNSYHWDQMISSNPTSSPCGELMGLRPMLKPNLTQNKEVQIPVERIWGSGIDPRVNKMLFWDRSQYSEGSVPQQHIVDSGINPRTPFFWRWDWSQTLIGISHFHMQFGQKILLFISICVKSLKTYLDPKTFFKKPV